MKFWALRIWCSASLTLSTRCWKTTSLRAQWRKPCRNSSTTSSCTCRSLRTRWGTTGKHQRKCWLAKMDLWGVKKSVGAILFFFQIKAWTANPQQFVEDEDDDTFSYSVRISAQDLLLVRRKPTNLIVKFHKSKRQHFKDQIVLTPFITVTC